MFTKDSIRSLDQEKSAAGKKGKAMADQLATVSKQRLSKCVGSISDDEMNMVVEAIKTQLDLF